MANHQRRSDPQPAHHAAKLGRWPAISRLSKKTIGIIIALSIAAFTFLTSAHLGIQYALHMLLVDQADSTGMDWAHHIEARSPNLASILANDSTPAQKKAPATVEFLDMINGMLSVGNIYQVDVINSDCYCYMSLGSYSAKQAGRNTAIPSTHSPIHLNPTGILNLSNKMVHMPVGQPTVADIGHVFQNTSPHTAKNLFGGQQNRFPVDWSFVMDLTSQEKRNILIQKDKFNNQPKTFAEVYHPVQIDGKLSYILRLLVDLQAENTRFSKTLYAGSAIMMLFLLAAFGYPAAQYLRVSKKQRAADTRMHFLANHDVMTNIHNRNAFQESAPKILERYLARKQEAILILLDLDKFKEINDYHTHLAGDQMLRAMAERLKDVLPPDGRVARLGGDEFVVMVKDEGNDDIMNISTNLQTSINHGTQIIETTISGGAVRFPRDGDNLDDLMRNADLALYEGKSNGGGSIVKYEPHMGVAFHKRIELREEFRNALENGHIEPYYQPLMNVKTGQLEGFETLARWIHPDKGILSAFMFEELLHDRELGAALGALMFNKIVQDMKRWKKDGVPFERCGLNICEGDLLNPGFALNIISKLAKHDLTPHNLAIEVTETCMFGDNKEKFANQLALLRNAGSFVALDDFGTGYSSITQIKDLPYSTLKIDKSFIDDVVSNKTDQAIIKALVGLGKSMNFRLVMEGVETQEQLDLLKSLGCEIVQGYYFSKPVPASRVPALIETLVNHSHTAIQSPKLNVVA